MEGQQKPGDKSDIGSQAIKAINAKPNKSSEKSEAKMDNPGTHLRKRLVTSDENSVPVKIAKTELKDKTTDSVKETANKCGIQVADQTSQSSGTDTLLPKKRSAEIPNEPGLSPSKKAKGDVDFGDEAEKKHIRRRMKCLLQQVMEQMEFYFGDSNLSKDRYLKKLLEESSDRYVDLSVFGNFFKLQSLHKNGVSMSILVKALKNSKMLELNENKTKVRRITPIKEISQEEIDSRTIYVEDLPSTATHQWIQTIFSQCGKVVYVSLPTYKSTRQIKGFAFVEFETSEEATKACSMLNNPRPAKAEEKPGKFPKGNKALYRLQKLAPFPAETNSNEENISDDQKVDPQTASTHGSKKKKKKKARKKKPQDNDDTAAEPASANQTETADWKKKKKKKKKKQNQSLEAGNGEEVGLGNEEQGTSALKGIEKKDTIPELSDKFSTADKCKSENVTSSRENKLEKNSPGRDVKPEQKKAETAQENMSMEVPSGREKKSKKDTDFENSEDFEIDESKNNPVKLDQKSEDRNLREEITTENNKSDLSCSEVGSKKKKRKKKKKKKKEEREGKGEEKVGNANSLEESLGKRTKQLSQRKERKLLRQADIRRKKMEKEMQAEGLLGSLDKTEDSAGVTAQMIGNKSDIPKKDQTELEEMEDSESLMASKRRSDGSELTSILKSRKGQERKKVEFDPVPVTTEFVKGREIRKRKKPKREKLHLRVITKKEWSALKAEYISQQKSHMAALKESLRELRQQESQGQSDGRAQVKGHMNLEDVFGTKRLKPSDDVKMAHVESLKFTPNVIVQWKCSHEMHRDKIKAMFRDTLGDSIAYIDAKEEAKSGYIRFKDEASAEEFTRLSRPSTLFFTRVLPADQQQAYWDRANEDRLKKLAKKRQEKGSERIARKVFERNKATFNQKPSRIVFNDDDEVTDGMETKENGVGRNREESLQEHT